jgi:Short-chain alcohol dehydrogenase of unknown specificity
MDVRGISAIVTGGASGLGAATARALHHLGATVVIADVHAEAGEALAGELGDGALFVATDVTDPVAVERAIDAAVRRAPLGVLVNCAGIGLAQKVLGKEGPHDLAAFERVIRVNLVGTFNALRLAAAAMRGNAPNADGERGVIVNTASVAAFEGQIGQAAYSASKGGWRPSRCPRRGSWPPTASASSASRRASSTRRCWPGCPNRCAVPSASRFRSPNVSDARRNTPRWCATSCRTRCSMARRSASTARCAWRRDKHPRYALGHARWPFTA